MSCKFRQQFDVFVISIRNLICILLEICSVVLHMHLLSMIFKTFLLNDDLPMMSNGDLFNKHELTNVGVLALV